MGKTLVTITIDTEASIAGAFDAPGQLMPNLEGPVDGMVNGRSEALGFLVETFRRFDICATFFVETMQTRFFGDSPMADRCRILEDAGQDVQLHVHPTWRSFSDGKLVAVDQDDRSFGRPPDELQAIYAEAQDSFIRLTGRPAVAARAGNFATNSETFSAMRSAGITVTSNICVAVHPPPDRSIQLSGGRRKIDDVLEIPVTCFEAVSPSGGKRLRPLQVTACGLGEMIGILEQASARDAGHVMIVTHPFEFIKKADDLYSRLKANQLVQRRMTAVCDYLNNNRDRFEVVSMADCAGRREQLAELPPATLDAPLGATMRRVLENGINDRLWAL